MMNTNEGGPPIPVVAAVARRGDRFLVARRPLAKRHGGKWEFPGGKLLDGESLEGAARRELREELGLEVEALGPVLFRARDPGSRFEIHFTAAEVTGTPAPTEHTEVGWLTHLELRDLDLAPADARFVLEGWVDP